MLKYFAALVALVLPLSLPAALQWDKLSYTVKATAADTKAEAVYSFKNTGKNTVTIDEIKSSCGCTTAEMKKREYTPGESGSVKAVFTFGERVGKQHKTIAITMTDGGETTQAMLELFVDIPEGVTIDPRIHFWMIGDKLVARQMNIKLGDSFPGKPTKAHLFSEHSNFVITQPTLQKDGTYQMTVTPKSTAEMDTEAGEIVVEIPGAAEPKKYLFYASIRQ
jgi:hypothetical protein